MPSYFGEVFNLREADKHLVAQALRESVEVLIYLYPKRRMRGWNLVLLEWRASVSISMGEQVRRMEIETHHTWKMLTICNLTDGRYLSGF